MKDSILWIIAAVVFAVQLLLCLKAQRVIIRLAPTLVLAAAVIGCFAGYAVSGWTNWGFLILAVLILPILVIDGIAWLAAALIKRLRRPGKVQ